MPGKQRFGSDDGCYQGQSTATKRLGANRESTTLIVGETKTMTTELLSEDAILFRQVVNDVLLALIEVLSLCPIHRATTWTVAFPPSSI